MRSELTTLFVRIIDGKTVVITPLRNLQWNLFWHFIAYTICALFTLAAALVSVHRHWQFETQYYDFGIFDSAIRSVAKFQPPLIDHLSFDGQRKWIFADHFHPAIFLLSPLYWFMSGGEGILVAQAVAVGLSALVLYRISVYLLKDSFLSVAVLTAYVSFVGLQNALITDFHEITVMTLPMMLCYWAIITERRKWSVAFLVLTLAFKELMFGFGVGLAIFIWIYRPPWKKLALLTAGYSVVWGVLSIKVIIPFFAGKDGYQYLPASQGVGALFSQFFLPIEKLVNTGKILWSFGFLPLLYVPTLPIIVMNLGMRFLAESPDKWGLGYHYNAELAPTLAVSAALALVFLQKKLPQKIVWIIGGLLIVNSLVLHRFIFRGPLGLAYNPAFYAHTQNFAYLEDFLDQVPADKKVMTQNNLAPRFTDREVTLLRAQYQPFAPDLIVLDLRPGQNPNNFMGIADVNEVLSTLQNDPNYALFYHQGDQYIFQRR